MPSRRQEALDYHSQGRPGKIQVSPTKPFKDQRDLSLAYTPGVAEPCLEIAKRPEDAYTYTAKGNLVAVVSNGTAVLGLGNIGPLAGKPVMEGKGILFKSFADIDVFDLEGASEDPEDVVRFCQLLEEIDLANPRTAADRETLAQELFERRRRRGITLREARARVLDPMYYGLLMLRAGRADALVAGEEMYYPDAIRPALEVIGAEGGGGGRKHVSGIYMMIFRQQTFFFADCTVNIDPDAETLVEIASATAQFVWRLGVEPRVAMLSFSNFGSVKHPAADKVQRAVALLHEREPALQVDGEMQADTAVVERILTRTYPFAKLRSAANVLIFPSLDAANIAYKLLDRLGGAQAIGPILVGMDRPVHILQRGSEVPEIVNIAVIAAVDALEHRKKPSP